MTPNHMYVACAFKLVRRIEIVYLHVCFIHYTYLRKMQSDQGLIGGSGGSLLIGKMSILLSTALTIFY